MFTIKNLTTKNFMSVGNNTQAINFDRKDLTLVLGENLDLGGDDAGSRNGAGKSVIVNALSYALFGQAINDIRRDNLINRTNAKGMLATIDFVKDGVTYRIERGRKPNVLKFYKGDVAFAAQDDDAQGDSRETQAEIDRILGMSHDMFKNVVALNTYTEPFLSLRANDQRTIIEQLLGITVLSEKSDALKEQIRATKDTISTEEQRIKACVEANKKIEEQVAALKKRSAQWEAKHEVDIADLSSSLEELLKVDIDAEIDTHAANDEIALAVKKLDDHKKALARTATELTREERTRDTTTAEITALKDHKCHACGQDLHDGKQEEILKRKVTVLEEAEVRIVELLEAKVKINEQIAAIGSIGTTTSTFYKKIVDAHNHKSSVQHLTQQLEGKLGEVNPYSEQIQEMEEAALIVVDYTTIDAASKLKDHQEFLLKLLTNKDSFIRKRIIDQNLTYLNARLSYYLEKIGLPHTVVFQSDLTVSIEEFGRELDFYNLSRGEMTRVILALSLSFRDVWESAHEAVNLLFIDEMIDNGLDSSGVESVMGVLKRMARDSQKSIWLISHKDELISRVGNILKVQKEGGFTQYITDDTEDANEEVVAVE